jgi:hypothetical protein
MYIKPSTSNWYKLNARLPGEAVKEVLSIINKKNNEKGMCSVSKVFDVDSFALIFQQILKGRLRKKARL